VGRALTLEGTIGEVLALYPRGAQDDADFNEEIGRTTGISARRLSSQSSR
jgi:hypothetical protein